MSNAAENSFENKSFLVVDDFQGMRTVLRDILRSMGVNPRSIYTAANGQEAINFLAQTHFDGVLCDYNLGVGKNGQQVLEEAKVRDLVGPGCAWILISAEKTADIVMGAVEFQPDAYLIKPITEGALRLRLEKIWARKSAFGEIDRAVAAHDYLRAAKLCDERLAVDRLNRNELRRIKCQLLLQAEDYAQVRSLCDEVLAERDLPWAQLGLARCLFAGGDLDGARRGLEALVAENRAYLEAYDWLAKVLSEQGDLAGAAGVLENAARLSPNSVLRQKTLGEVALQMGEPDKAEKAFRKSVSLGENSVFKTADAYLGLAKSCSAQDRPQEALQVLGTVTKQFDDPTVKMKTLATEGMVHHKAGDPIAARKAAQALSAAIQESGGQVGSGDAVEMAELMLVTGEKDQAVALLQNEVRNNPEDSRLLSRVQQVFEAGAMGEEGSALVEASRKEALELMNQGVLLAKDGKLDEALGAMRAACERLPGNVRVLFNFSHLALAYARKNTADPALLEEIRQRLETAHRLSPGEKRYGTLVTQLQALTHSGGSGDATPTAAPPR